MKKRYFTPQEANQVLPNVKDVVSRLMKTQFTLQILSNVQVSFQDEFLEMLHQTRKFTHFHRLSYELFKDIDHLMSLGCIPQDIRIGLMDFYCLKDGQEVLLCWKAGEEGIDYWHDIESGFAGRRPISELYHHAKDEED